MKLWSVYCVPRVPEPLPANGRCPPRRAATTLRTPAITRHALNRVRHAMSVSRYSPQPGTPCGQPYPHLPAPLEPGTVTLKNRVVMGSMHTGLETLPDGFARLAAFYAARARGGAGLIVTGGVGVNPQALGAGAQDESLTAARVTRARASRWRSNIYQLNHPGHPAARPYEGDHAFAVRYLVRLRGPRARRQRVPHRTRCTSRNGGISPLKRNSCAPGGRNMV
jgi:hypothetical protein